MYYLYTFKEDNIIALKKPEEDNYTMLKIYKPIALINILDKALKAFIAKKITYLAE